MTFPKLLLGRTVSVVLAVTLLLWALPAAAKTSKGPVAQFTVNPTTLSFTAADGTSERQSFTIQNTGSSPISGVIGPVSGTGFNDAGASGSFTLNPSDSQVMNVFFDPSKAGNYKGKLTVTVGKAKKTVSLKGKGTPQSSGTVELFGGVPNTVNIIAKSESFNTSTGKFSSIPSLPDDSHGFIHEAPYLDPAVVSGGSAGQIFISGGQDNANAILDSTLLFNPASNSYTDGPTLLTARAEHTATLFRSGPLQGDVMIIGGLQINLFSGERIALNAQEFFEPSSGSMFAGPDMHDRRGQHTATLLDNGKILVTGGYDENFDSRGNEATATAELYDPVANSFSCVTAGASSATTTSNCPDVMSSTRWNHRATLLPDGTVLVTGGTPTDSGLRIGTASADLYDPGSNSFSKLPDMKTARQGHTATLIQGCHCALDGMVLIAGGQDQNANVTNTAELYNPASKTFTAISHMTMPRAEAQAVGFTTGDLAGGVLIMGGYPKPNELGTTSAELFNPLTKKFTKVGSMASQRYEFPATLVPPS